jgi:hypothetical protein
MGIASVPYVSTVLGPVRTGILAVADNTTVGGDVVFAEGCVKLSDGGGGLFRWDSGGGTDDGGTVIVPGGTKTGSTGPCWRRVYSGAVNARWFGAQGDGNADDTCALQQALNFLMAIPNGGKLYIPSGVYKITSTLTLVGDNAHNYVIEGDIGGQTYNTQILWAGPAGCTMLDCWGINDSFFRHLTFNGGGHSLFIDGSQVSSLGAGCCTWFHTNQFSTVMPNDIKGITPGADSMFVYFEDVTWAGVVGGIYAACAVGDGPLSPGSVTVDEQRNYTAYLITGQVPPSTGRNAVDTVHSTTLTQDTPSSQTKGVASVFDVADTTGFTVNRALIATKAGQSPWVGRITNITQTSITVLDENQSGLTKLFGDMPAGSTVYNAFPNAVAVPLPASSKIVNLPSDIANSACQGFVWEKCNFLGGGYDTTVPYWMAGADCVVGQVVRANPDNGLFFVCTSAGKSGSTQPAWDTAVGASTSDGPVTWTTQIAGAAQYCYAGVAIYSGYNTEQFGWRDCLFLNQRGVFGIYSPANANNEWFVENVQFWGFSGAAVCLGQNNDAKLTMYQCGSESNTGFGYFVWDGGNYQGCLNMDGCEVAINAIGNPYTAAVVSSGPTRIERCFFQHQYADLGSDAQPLSIIFNPFENRGVITIENCNFYAEQYQIPVFLNGGPANELFASYFGGVQNTGTNRTHQWAGVFGDDQLINEVPLIAARLRGNSGSEPPDQPGDGYKVINLPDVDYQPTTLFAVGPVTNNIFKPSATETYRAQPRTTTSCYDVDWMQVLGGGIVYLCLLQDRTIVRGVVVECTAPFSPGSTFSLGTQLGLYKDVFSSVSIPSQDGVLMSSVTNDKLNNTWKMNGFNAVGLILDQAPTSGHLRIYITTELLQVA